MRSSSHADLLLKWRHTRLVAILYADVFRSPIISFHTLPIYSPNNMHYTYSVILIANLIHELIYGGRDTHRCARQYTHTN